MGAVRIDIYGSDLSWRSGKPVVVRGETHGYQARAYRWGRRHTKMFSDGVWGGRKKAQQAALRWCNEQQKIKDRQRRAFKRYGVAFPNR